MGYSLENHRERYLRVFLLAFITAGVIFLPFVIMDKGLFLYYGDFNVQQIPFNMLAHDAIRSGNVFWSWTTDLGANFLGSYSFYMLGSPFFYLTLPFPSAAVPYLIAPLLCLKMAVAALTGYAFIRRFVKSPDAALIGGLLYAFSGFSAYNIFFNHFHDAMAFFPLLLIALEELVINNRKGAFALAVALCAIVNYFFFFGEVTFVILYFFVRCFSPDFKVNFRKVLCIGLEAVLGVGVAAFMLLPSALAIVDNPRVDSPLTGFGYLFYSNVQRYGLIIQSFFFPPDIPARPNFFPDSNAKWGSVAGYLPLFSMAGVIVFIRDMKRHWAKRLVLICIFMAFIPILNSAFYAFNSSYYARWYFMPILIMAFMTAFVLDSGRDGERGRMDLLYGVKWCFVIILAFSVIGVLPSGDKEGNLVFGQLPASQPKFWTNVVLALLFILVTVYLVTYRSSHRRFLTRCIAGVCIASFLCTGSMLIFGRTIGFSYHQVAEMGIRGRDNFDLPPLEDGFYRIDVFKGMDNYPMFWQMPTIQAFHSIVPASTMAFYDSIGVQRDVASRPDIAYHGLRGLLSVKYLFCPTYNEDDDPKVPGFEYYDTQNDMRIYENKAFIPMGYTYDYYVDKATYEKQAENKRDRLMLKGLYLSDFQIKRYGSLLKPLPGDASFDVSDDAYLADCEARRQETAYSFVTDNTGFTARSDLSRENLLVFSVPYDAGWTAMVNGSPAQIEEVNVGFMAVRVPAGESVIRFDYTPPGLLDGLGLTVTALFLLALYLVIWMLLERKYPQRFGVRAGQHLYGLDLLDSVKANDAYISQLSSKIAGYPQTARPAGQKDAGLMDFDMPADRFDPPAGGDGGDNGPQTDGKDTIV